MAESPKRVAVFGSTGSIGANALEVIAASEGRLRAVALSAHSRVDELAAQAKRFKSRWIVVTNPKAAKRIDRKMLPKGCELLVGPEALAELAQHDDVDVLLAGIVGRAGLESTWAALEKGKTVALANKETMVMAGELVSRLAAEKGGQLLPVDSEHSALFQALRAGATSEVAKLVLTASGGPFKDLPLHELQQITVAEALAHPTWDMGPKITIDSATMMNKALEIVEARWLFGVDAKKIEVVIHPQSVVHSLVEFIDGSVIAQMSPPDMRLPIQYALHYPQRVPGVAKRIDWRQSLHLNFEPPDRDRFPAIALGEQSAQAGGSAGAVLNAANEAAVQSFLDGDLHFTEIVPACRSILKAHNHESKPTLQQLVKLDAWARQEVSRWVCA